MSPRIVFWIPAILRLSGVVIAGCGLSYFFGPMIGVSCVAITLAILMLVQLQYLYRLAEWLDRPHDARLPDGWGAWTDIFSKLYRLRRLDQRNQADLAEWLARFRQAMSLLPDGVAIVDDVLFLEWCNPAAEQHLGFQLERDKGMRVTNLIRHPQFIDYIILGKYEQPLALSVQERKLLIQIIPFENRRQILVTHDATESQQIDMMRRDFVANASHELRTPLTVINGFLEIAESQPELDRHIRLEHVKLMKEQGLRMQNLIEDMLTLTRLESVEYPVRMERVNIPALLNQIMQEALALSAGKHKLSLDVDGPDINGSKDELRSAFGNLVSNAIRYTPDGGKINIAWDIVSTGPRFHVKDTGIGIPYEHIKRLTERFYRVDKSRSRETKGTGLGLAIVKHVLLRHNAVLAVKSVPNEGSTFIINFPKTSVSVDSTPAVPHSGPIPSVGDDR
jgi:two-component system phosphate regulon sensor histidine kinase PhoR